MEVLTKNLKMAYLTSSCIFASTLVSMVYLLLGIVGLCNV